MTNTQITFKRSSGMKINIRNEIEITFDNDSQLMIKAGSFEQLMAITNSSQDDALAWATKSMDEQSLVDAIKLAGFDMDVIIQLMMRKEAA